MAADIPRLVAACDTVLFRQLIAAIAPDYLQTINWTLNGRALGQDVQRILSSSGPAWAKLQNIESLARHGSTASIRSVFYYHRKLRDEFDELDCGRESAAVWLALNDDELFEHSLSALHADQGLNKRSWKAFRASLSKNAKYSFDADALTQFEKLVQRAIQECGSFDAPGSLATHHFQRVLFPEHTHSRRVLDQVTVFAEARQVTEDAFVEKKLQTQVRKKVDSISLVFDRERRELDVVTLGGRKFIEDVANAFLLSFSDESPGVQPLIRRKINFELLLRKVNLVPPDQSRFVSAKIDEIRVRSPTGMLYTFDAKSHRNGKEDVYDIASADLGDNSPFEQNGWRVVSARVVLLAAPTKPGRRPRPRSIDLKPNGHTNLREQDDTDLYIADELLTRWGILEPLEIDDDED